MNCNTFQVPQCGNALWNLNAKHLLSWIVLNHNQRKENKKESFTYTGKRVTSTAKSGGWLVSKEIVFKIDFSDTEMYQLFSFQDEKIIFILLYCTRLAALAFIVFLKLLNLPGTVSSLTSLLFHRSVVWVITPVGGLSLRFLDLTCAREVRMRRKECYDL